MTRALVTELKRLEREAAATTDPRSRAEILFEVALRNGAHALLEAVETMHAALERARAALDAEKGC